MENYPFKTTEPVVNATADKSYYQLKDRLSPENFNTILQVMSALPLTTNGKDIKDLLIRYAQTILETLIQSGDPDATIGYILSEIENAKMGSGTLREKMEALLKVANSVPIGMDRFTQELKEYLANVAENGFPVVGPNSTGTENIINGSITMDKLNLNQYLPVYHSFANTEATRAETGVLSLKRGDVVKSVVPSSCTFALLRESSTGTYSMINQSYIDEYIIDKDGNYKIKARFNDNRTLSSVDRSVLSSAIFVITNKTSVQRDELIQIGKTLSNLLEVSLLFEYGSFSSSGVVNSEGINRARTTDWVKLNKGTVIKPKDSIHWIIIKEGKGGYLNGTAWNSTAVVIPETANYRISVRKPDDSIFSIQELTFLFTNFDIESPVRSATSTTRYVSKTGSDTNDGLSEGSPYLTIGRALEDRPSTILISGGTYVEEINYVGDIEIKQSDYKQGGQKVNVIGADLLNNLTKSGSLYKQSYGGNELFNNVFISKTQPPIIEGSRSNTFGCTIFEVKDKEIDYKMKPVLTLAECEAETGTFYFDGKDVYLNPQSINNKFYAVRLSRNKLSGNKVKISNINFGLYTFETAVLDSILDLDVDNCEFGYSVQADGASIDNTNAVFRNCLAYKNRNDGFNLHYSGTTTFINCSGFNNYDDGISHHEECQGVIIGGEWRGNGKGGISPAYGATVSWQNCILKDNAYGIYHEQYAGSANRSSGNLFIGNTVDIRTTNREIVSVGDVFANGVPIIEGENLVTRY